MSLVTRVEQIILL